MSSYNVRVILRGTTKHVLVSPAPMTRDDAEREIDAIKTARRDRTPVPITWLAVDGPDILAAHVEHTGDGDLESRSSDDVLRALEAKGYVDHQVEAGDAETR